MERCTPSAVAMASTLIASGASASTSRICTPRLSVCEGGLLGTAGAVMSPLRCTAVRDPGPPGPVGGCGSGCSGWGSPSWISVLLAHSLDGSATHFRYPAPLARHRSAPLARHMRTVYDPHQ